nr:MAG TPA: hypothetical protein [Caudoviricetes sp.]
MEKIKFKEGDYIINRKCGDIAIFDKVDKKGYMHFEKYYSKMGNYFKDITKYTLQINYQKFYDICTSEEKEKFYELL